MSPRTRYERAVAGYDPAYERELCDAIMKAVADASIVTDANAMVIRTGEVAAALLDTLAFVLALSPSATRSPTAIRKTCDELHKRLRRRVAAAESSQDVQDFARRIFRGDEGGHA